MKQGDIVLIWGASGGLGSYATQYALNGGAIPVCVVSSPEKAEICRRDGRRAGHRPDGRGLSSSGRTARSSRRSGSGSASKIRELTGGDDPDIVFEHPGRETFGASVYVDQARRHDRHLRLDVRLHARVRQPLPVDDAQADRRLALRQLPRVVGGQPADRARARSTRRCRSVYPLAETGQAAYDVHRNLHQGKVGVLCLAPAEGLGVRDTATARQAPRRDQPLSRELISLLPSV